MENLKIQIKIEDNDDLKEAHDLLLKLGFSTYTKESFGVWADQPKPIWLKTNYFDEQPNKIDWCFKESHGECKEITLPQLRDLVVLKRNNREDANFIDPEYDASLYLDSKGDLFVFHLPAQKWKESNLNGEEDVMARLKPIEKPMKEYLRKNSNGTYSYIGMVRPEHVSDFMIEIPEGATKLISHSYVHLPIMFVKPCANGYSYCYPNGIWSDTILYDINGRDIFWSRHTHPEELPFIDDEPLQSLNDQYAEIEKVRQSAWQKQEGGSHYKTLKIQPMQYALENKLDYAQANVVKYVTRHKEKNGKEDLLKAIHNIELMIEFYYGGGE